MKKPAAIRFEALAFDSFKMEIVWSHVLFRLRGAFGHSAGVDRSGERTAAIGINTNGWHGVIHYTPAHATSVAKARISSRISAYCGTELSS